MQHVDLVTNPSVIHKYVALFHAFPFHVQCESDVKLMQQFKMSLGDSLVSYKRRRNMNCNDIITLLVCKLSS